MRKIIFAVIVLAIAGLSFLAGGWYGKGQPNSTVQKTEPKVLYYVDPMNPGFRSDKPGIAPCGMPLEPVYADAGEGRASSLSPGTVTVSPSRQQIIGVKVAPAERRSFTYTLRLYGRVVPDETRIYRINASTDSWIRKISDATSGSVVEKGSILAEALAPAFYNAQVTYLVSLDNIDRIKQQLGGELRHQQADLADNQIRLAVQGLQNLGITDAQVEELANTRQARPHLQVRSPVRGVVLSRNITLYQWFKAGEEFYSIADIGKVWVYADVYENEAEYLKPGLRVKIKHAQTGRSYSAEVSSALPLFNAASRTLKVRLDVDNPRYDLRPDMFVDVEIPATTPPSLNLPADAVIDSGMKTIVYVDAGNGAFEPRRVETGWRLGRQVEITAGLMAGEKVVVSGNFLIDSESRMKTAAAGMQAEMNRDPVCGMFINEELAERSGRTSQLQGRTYFFCSKECIEAFGKEPKKYVGKDARFNTPAPVTSDQSLIRKGPAPGKKTEYLPDKTAGVSGTAGRQDAGTKDKEPKKRDWSGWGAFPGAEYLGIGKKKAGSTSGEQSTVPEACDENTPEGDEKGSVCAPPAAKDDEGPELNHDMHEQPALPAGK